MNDRANWLVAAQFALFLLLLLPGAPLWSEVWVTTLAVVLALAGGGLAVAGFVVLGTDLVPWVAPRPGAPLRTNGVYRFSRNPIYLGILIATAGWVLWRARIELVVVWLLLAIVLVAKALVEERRLAAIHGDGYRAYAERTPLFLGRRGARG